MARLLAAEFGPVEPAKPARAAKELCCCCCSNCWANACVNAKGSIAALFAAEGGGGGKGKNGPPLNPEAAATC